MATNTSLRLNVSSGPAAASRVLDVNYGGSTGFGRAYRELLLAGPVGHRRRRGLRCRRAPPRRARPGRCRAHGDPRRSAGGFTTLCALTFHDVFKAGASYYGVSDLAGLDADTHKFESHYTDYLVAPHPTVALYRERSPLAHTDRLNSPDDLLPGAGRQGGAAGTVRVDGARR